MPDGNYDFGSALDIVPAEPNSPEAANGAPQPNVAPFGSGLFGRQRDAYANRPQNTDSPLADRIQSVEGQRKSLQRAIDNPLGAFLYPNAWREKVKEAGDLDQQVLQTQQAIQKVKADRDKAVADGMNPTTYNVVPWQTADEQTKDNAWQADLADANFNAYKHFAALGERGQAVIGQLTPILMPKLGERNDQAQGIIDQLDTAVRTNQYAAKAAELDANGEASRILANYAPGFVIPKSADAWNVRGKGVAGSVAAARQIKDQYDQQQSQMTTLTRPETDPKVAEAFHSTLFKNSQQEPLEGGSVTNLPSGERGLMYGPKSIDPSKYGKPDGWNNLGPKGYKEYNDLLGEEQTKGIVSKYKTASEFAAQVNDPKTFTSTAGVASVYDKFGALERNVTEGSRAAGTVGLTRQFEAQMGPIDQVLNRLQQARSAFDGAVDKWTKNGKVGPMPRLDSATIDGLKQVADFQHALMLNQVKERIGEPLHQLGRLGGSLSDARSGLDKELRSDPDLNGMVDAGRREFLKDYTNYKYTNQGDRAVLLPPGSANKNARNFAMPKEDAPAGLTPDQQKQASTPQADLYAKTVIQAESGGKPGQVTGSYKGLGQFSDEEMLKHGITNPDDRGQVEAALKRDYVTNKSAIQRATGVIPTNTQVYLAHQQGLGGIEAHMKNPDAPAWQNMASTAEGQRKGADWAKRAVWGNVPDDMKSLLAKNGVNVNNLTSGDFMGLWNAKFSHIAARVQKYAGAAASAMSGPAGAAMGAYQALPEGAQNAIKSAAVDQAPAIGSTIGAVGLGLGGTAVGGPVGGVAGGMVGGAAGGAAGQAVKNYMTGADLSKDVARETAMGAVQGIVPEGRPLLGVASRMLGSGVVEGTNEALTNPNATPHEIVEKGLGAAGLQALGEGAFRVFGTALGRAGAHFNDLTPAAQAELRAAGEVVAGGKPEAPKTPPGGVVSEAAKAEHETAVKEYDDAVQTIKAKHFDPEDVAHAVKEEKKQTGAGQAILSTAANKAKRDVGNQLNEVAQDVATAGRGNPVPGVAPFGVPVSAVGQTNRIDGPLSLIGKAGSGVTDTPAVVASLKRAERDAFRPAESVGEQYQNIFDARSDLIADANNWRGATAPDEATRRSLMAAANNLGEHQRQLLIKTYGPVKGGKMADKVEGLRSAYAELSNLSTDGDIVGALAKQDASGAEARRVFKKYAGDDVFAQRMADTLVKDRQTSGKGAGGKLLTYATAGLLHTVGFPVGVAAILAGEMPGIVNGWAARRAAGGPASLKVILQQRARAITAQQQQAEQRAAAAAGRGLVGAVMH